MFAHSYFDLINWFETVDEGPSSSRLALEAPPTSSVAAPLVSLSLGGGFKSTCQGSTCGLRSLLLSLSEDIAKSATAAAVCLVLRGFDIARAIGARMLQRLLLFDSLELLSDGAHSASI